MPQEVTNNIKDGEIMGVFHFLNVKEGDCSIIKHASGHTTVFDVCNAYKEDLITASSDKLSVFLEKASGNLNQKRCPVNPITYMKAHGYHSVFRFVLSHPDMDHMDGIKDFFEEFQPVNFWDTENRDEKEFGEGARYNESDWEFYKSLRDGNPSTDPKRLTLYAGTRGKFYNEHENGNSGGDGIYILAPTSDLINHAVESDDYNDASYVILYKAVGGRILLAGDSHDATWEYILANHADEVRDIDLLIAPHHGRKSSRSYEFLDVVNPTLTLFGNARSEHLAYDAWSYRRLPYITNNQANCIIVNADVTPMELFVTNEEYAKKQNTRTWYSSQFQGWFLGFVERRII